MTFNRIVLCIALLLLAKASFAQTEEHRWNIAIGGGPQDYKSSVGNGFKISSETSWHGAGLLQVSNYLNKSLDLMFFASIGDLGGSRVKSVGISLKYKFANGYLLDESIGLKPYVYLGAAFNNLTYKEQLGKIPDANYMSVNGGLGVCYNIFWRLSIGYNLGMGGFLIDNTSIGEQVGSREMFLHNALLLSIDI